MDLLDTIIPVLAWNVTVFSRALSFFSTLFSLGITLICSLSPCGVTSLTCHHSSSEALMTVECHQRRSWGLGSAGSGPESGHNQTRPWHTRTSSHSFAGTDPDPELMLLFIICSCKSCIFDSKRLYSGAGWESRSSAEKVSAQAGPSVSRRRPGTQSGACGGRGVGHVGGGEEGRRGMGGGEGRRRRCLRRTRWGGGEGTAPATLRLSPHSYTASWPLFLVPFAVPSSSPFMTYH